MGLAQLCKPQLRLAPLYQHSPNLKIILVSNTAWYLWNFRRGLIKALIQAGGDIYVLAPEDRTVPYLDALGCNTIFVPVHGKGINPFEDLGLFFRYRKIFSEIKPDAIIRMRGVSFFDLDKKEDALDFARQAISINPNKIEGWVSAGWCSYELEEYDEAREILEELVSKSQEDGINLREKSRALVALSFVESRVGNTSAAREKIKDLRLINPNFSAVSVKNYLGMVSDKQFLNSFLENAINLGLPKT